MDQSLKWSMAPVHCRGLWTKNQIFWVTPGGYVHVISLSLNPGLVYLSIWGAMRHQHVLGLASGASEKHNNINQCSHLFFVLSVLILFSRPRKNVLGLQYSLTVLQSLTFTICHK